MGLFGSGTNKATENWLEKREEGETRKIQAMYRHVQNEAHAVVKELGMALALYHKGMDKNASNYVKYAYGAIRSTIFSIEAVEKEEYKLQKLAVRLVAKVPKDKAIERHIQQFTAGVKTKTNDLLARAKHVLAKERPIIETHRNISQQEAVKYMATFQDGINIFHNIGNMAGEIASSFDKLYKMELRYLSK
jgi:hypothetical protein